MYFLNGQTCFLLSEVLNTWYLVRFSCRTLGGITLARSHDWLTSMIVLFVCEKLKLLFLSLSDQFLFFPVLVRKVDVLLSISGRGTRQSTLLIFYCLQITISYDISYKRYYLKVSVKVFVESTSTTGRPGQFLFSHNRDDFRGFTMIIDGAALPLTTPTPFRSLFKKAESESINKSGTTAP